MRHLLTSFIVSVLLLAACSSDFNEFGKSDYHTLNAITFDGESAMTQMYPDERLLIASFPAADSGKSYDSLTIDSLDISSLADLYLVESKVLSIPSDSVERDSFARTLSLSEDPLREGDRIRLPQSREIYLMLRSESGFCDLWKLQVKIAGEVLSSSSANASGASSSSESGSAVNSSSSVAAANDASLKLQLEGEYSAATVSGGNGAPDTIKIQMPIGSDLSKCTLDTAILAEGATISPAPSSVKDWSSPKKFTVTAEDGTQKIWIVSVTAVKNSAKNLFVIFKNQFSNARDESAGTITVKLNAGTDIASAAVDSFSVSDGATVSPKPVSVTDWSSAQKFTVTAEDGTAKTWTVNVSVAAAGEKTSSAANILSLKMDPAATATKIDTSKHTVALTYASSENLTMVYFDSYTFSEGASLASPMNGYLDLSSGSATMTVQAADGTQVQWTVSVAKTYVAPKITAMKIAGTPATIDDSLGTITVNSLTYLADLTQLAVTGLTFTDGASSADIANDGAYDLRSGKTVTVKTVDGQSKTYTIKAGYQYPNNSFSAWSGNVATEWANGNTSGFNMTTPTSDKSAAHLESMDAKILGIGQFASGNIFTGYFNPKSVGSLSMLNDYDDGNELIDFGRPFKGRPAYVEIDFSYTGSGDSCDMYILLENRTLTANDGRNQYRGSSDVNTLVASAWYRAATDTDTSDPDVVSITTSSSGYKTLRMKFTYGKPDDASPIYESNTFSTSLKNSSGVDNHLVVGTGNEDVTHIRIVMASSAQGNVYKGTVGATLTVDEIRLIY